MDISIYGYIITTISLLLLLYHSNIWIFQTNLVLFGLECNIESYLRANDRRFRADHSITCMIIASCVPIKNSMHDNQATGSLTHSHVHIYMAGCLKCYTITYFIITFCFSSHAICTLHSRVTGTSG